MKSLKVMILECLQKRAGMTAVEIAEMVIAEGKKVEIGTVRTNLSEFQSLGWVAKTRGENGGDSFWRIVESGRVAAYIANPPKNGVRHYNGNGGSARKVERPAPVTLTLPVALANDDGADAFRIAFFDDCRIAIGGRGGKVVMTPAEIKRAYEFMDQTEPMWGAQIKADGGTPS